ncbi:uncharacterized protein HMPREF1541_00526 [Cyphellophora europaea CBS 101466]|uniref:HMG box domain-containing protein n=1 Tax=Cyphellophora europaea (strain CBS 101466) TaxID=1220924 RepID=W2SCB7_CYPE1|nr:uncharacterized protein HMPREF1541_00526 [Cyphellophora europaea CBS 101466]ETN46342.1 hypothetical protein HMPREF1541_00526 [Cyphellophora europaea CBS 101466]
MPFEGIQTRSGRSLRSPESLDGHRRGPSPRKRPPRRRAGKAPKGGPAIDQPLSVLTEGYDVPVRDMELWANRPVEVRMQEAAKKNGYISRPMNSFMLYRSAYAERVKKFCKENNHQVVSQVTGASWPLEPDEIRKKYEKLALLERDNHQAAHPEYKFAPNKAGKKRARDEDDSDSDCEWGGGKRSRTGGSVRRDDTRSNTATPFEGDHWPYGSPGPYAQYGYANPSSYAYQYPDRQMPVYPDQRPTGNQYWQAQVRPYAAPGQVEDVHFSKTEDPFPLQDNMLSMVGLPNADGQHLLGDGDAAAFDSGDAMLDPRLGGLDPNYAVQSIEGAPRVSYAQQEPFHPGNATLTDMRAWDERVGSDFDREFQQFST